MTPEELSHLADVLRAAAQGNPVQYWIRNTIENQRVREWKDSLIQNLGVYPDFCIYEYRVKPDE